MRAGTSFPCSKSSNLDCDLWLASVAFSFYTGEKIHTTLILYTEVTLATRITKCDSYM